MRVALLGMPNCGKSTLFCRLTGERVPIGNRAGVTVQAKSASLRFAPQIKLWDLPGIRRARADSPDEQVTKTFLQEGGAELILAVSEVENRKQQWEVLREITKALPRQIPIFVILNGCDKLKRFPDLQAEPALQVLPLFAVSARTGQGLERLEKEIRNLFQTLENHSPLSEKNPPQRVPYRESSFPDADSLFARILHPSMQKRISLALGEMRISHPLLKKRLDALFLHPCSGIPLFFTWMAGVLYLTFSAPGNLLCEWFSRFLLSPMQSALQHAAAFAPPWLSSLLGEAVPNGVGTVLSFLPRFFLLFFLQGFLEQSGMSARFAKLFDPILQKAGLRGDAVVPWLLGYGCTVPALLCTQGMKDGEASARCKACLPLLPCSARMPLCLCLGNLLFPKAEFLLPFCVWLFGGCLFFLYARVLSKRQKSKASEMHGDALPPWQIPAPRELFGFAWEQIKHFLTRAGGMILLCSAALKLLCTWMPGKGITPPEQSLLAFFAKGIAPWFVPLGLGDWRTVSALVIGIGAKEASLSTLAVLAGGEEGIAGMFTKATGCSFLAFYLCYFPCLATVGTLRSLSPRRSTQKKKGSASPYRLLLPPLIFAWIASFVLYQILRGIL